MRDHQDYEKFLRRHFGDIWRWSAEHAHDEDEAVILAQRVALDLFRAMRRTPGLRHASPLH